MTRFKQIGIVFLVAALMLFSAAAAFSDVADTAWYAPEVKAMAARGAVKGYVDGTFGPEWEVSRGEFVALAARCFARETPARAGEYWCAGTLDDARSLGWLPPAWEELALTAENFETPITREEAVYTLMGAKGGGPEDAPAGAEEIRDLAEVDPALRRAVLWAYGEDIATGLPDGRFDPKGRLTRAQAAVLLYRVAPKEQIGLKAVNSWDSGEDHFTQYELTVTSPQGCQGWAAELTGTAEVQQSWNCRIERTPEGLAVRPVEYNESVPAGGSVTVGFIAKGEALALLGASLESPAEEPGAGPETEVLIPVGEVKPLHVEGTHLADPEGNAVQLRGVSTHGLAWFPQYVSEDAFRTLRDDWGCNAVRLAMYTAEYGGYLNGGDQEALEELIEKGVRAADALGMYAIIDWHILSDGVPTAHTQEAAEFFGRTSAKYAQYDNVLYEICNEPQNSPWQSVIKPYAETVLAAIRANDPDAVVIVGTNTWSQEVEEVIGHRLEDPNAVYAFHFYAATHKESYRQKVVRALDAGVPVFVSECGLCDASGSGGVDRASAQAWFDLLNSRGVSFVAWSLCNKNETAALIRPDCQKLSGWTTEDLSESGQLFRQAILER